MSAESSEPLLVQPRGSLQHKSPQQQPQQQQQSSPGQLNSYDYGTTNNGYNNDQILQQQQQQSYNAPLPSTGGPHGLTRFRYIAIILCLLAAALVLGFIAFRLAGAKVTPIYVMYNATIYASSQHHGDTNKKNNNNDKNKKVNSPLSLDSTLSTDLNPLAGKSGINPFEYNTAMVIGSDGRFYDLGYDDEILNNEHYSSLPRVNMNKATISPGFADAHGHFMSYGLGFLEPDVRTAQSPTQFIQQLLSFCKEYNIDPQAPSDSWLIGGRWDESQWATDKDYDYYVDPETGAHPFPTHKMLDKAFPKLGVALKRVDAHACFVNQVVLDAIEIPDQDPPGGKIIRDESGKPTGVFIDYACEIIWKYKQSQPTQAHYRTALTKSMQQLNAMGLTSVHDASMLNSELFASHLQIGRKMVKNTAGSSLYDPFPLRVHGMVDAEAICAVYNYTCPDPFPFNIIDQNNPVVLKNGTNWVKKDSFEVNYDTNRPDFDLLPKVLSSKNGRFDVSATKLMSDGALGSWGAYLSQPYTDKPTTQGIQMYTPAQLNNAVLNLANQGFQVCTHAIGDGAVQEVLDSYGYAGEHIDAENDVMRRAKFIAKRHRIEHFQIIPPDTWIDTMAKYGILASMQSIHAVQDRSFAETRLGKERLEKQGYLWRDIEKNNDLIALGTDFPVSSPNVIENLYAAVTMKEIGHDLPPFLPQDTLNIIDALMGVTSDAAYAQGRENEYGRIAKGFIADFVILSEDWLGFTTISDKERDIGEVLEKSHILATFVDGNAVYENERSTIKTVNSDKKQYEFITNTTSANVDKKPWYAIRQPKLSPMDKVSVSNSGLIEVVNELKKDTLSFLQQSTTNGLFTSLNHLTSHPLMFKLYLLDNQKNEVIGDNNETIIIDQLMINNEQNIDEDQNDEKLMKILKDLEFWNEMRFIALKNRPSLLESYLSNSFTIDSYNHSFKTFSDTPVKEIERIYGHHHHAKDNSKYRAQTIYKTKSRDGQDILVQPRVPPCIEHMGTREAAERRYFAYEGFERVKAGETLGLEIVN